MAGINTRMPWREAERRLRHSADILVQWTLVQIAVLTREHGAVPVFVALDNVVDPPADDLRALHDAAAAGFLVFNLFDLWKGRDQHALGIAAWDKHPNAAANRLIAERVFELIQHHRVELQMGAIVPDVQARRP